MAANNVPPVPVARSLSFKNPIEMQVYMIIDRLTMDANMCAEHLKFLKNAGLPIDDQDISMAILQLKNIIEFREAYYKKISSGLILASGPLPKT